MADQQDVWDAELLAEFRQKTRKLLASLRQLQQAETIAKKAYRSRKAQRKSMQSGFDAMLFADSGDDKAFVSGIQKQSQRLSEAEENERAARQEWKQAAKKRQDAKYRLTAHVETFMAPLPLFDRQAQPVPPGTPGQASVGEKKPRKRRAAP